MLFYRSIVRFCLLYITLCFSTAINAGEREEVTFHEIAAIGDRMPGTSLKYKMFQDVSISTGNVVFIGIGDNMHYGIYGYINNALVTVAETGSEVPGGGKFKLFASPAIFNESVVFRGISRTDNGERHEGIYLKSNGKIVTIVDDSMKFPDSESKYKIFFRVAVYDGDVVFRAAGDGVSGIYRYSDGVVRRIVDESVQIPNSQEVFAGTMEPTISQGIVAFKGYQNTINGIYLHDDNGIEIAADTRTPVPGRNEYFEDFTVPSNSARTVAFWSKYEDIHNGIYLYNKGKLSVVADDSTNVPDRQAHFSRFQDSPSVSGNKVAFLAHDSDGLVGIYLHDGDVLHKIVDTLSVIDGKQLYESKGSLEGFRARSYDGNRLVFVAKFRDYTNAIYVADTPW